MEHQEQLPGDNGTRPDGTRRSKRPRGLEGNEGVIVEKVPFNKKEGWVNLLLVTAYSVQCKGQCSAAEVFHDLSSVLGIKVQQRTVSEALEALKKKEIVACAYNAEAIAVYSMKRHKFNCSVEIAQGPQPLVSALQLDTAGALIVQEFSKGLDKERYPSEPADYKVVFELLQPMLGGNTWKGNDTLQALYFNGPYYTFHKTDEHGDLLLEDGKPVLLERFQDEQASFSLFGRMGYGEIEVTHPHAIAGWLRGSWEGGRPIEKRSPYSIAKYFQLESIIYKPDRSESGLNALNLPTRPGLVNLPIQRDEQRNTGAGIGCYEALMPGTRLTWEFSAPTRDYIEPKVLKDWLARILRRCPRSMSHARGRAFGRAALITMEFSLWSSGPGEWIEV